MLKEIRYKALYRGSADAVREELMRPALCNCRQMACWLPVLSLQDILRSTYGISGLIAGEGTARFLLRFDLDGTPDVGKPAPINFNQQIILQVGKLFDEVRSPRDKLRLGLLAWLYANARLSISFAVTTTGRGSTAFSGLPPTLCGMVSDGNDDHLSYVLADSDNVGTGELIAECAWSWGDPGRHVLSRAKCYDRVWSSNEKGVMIVPFPEELRQKLLVFLPSILPNEEPGIVDEDAGNRPTLYRHQERGLQNWAANGYRGIFKMCTGAGKTIAALEGIRRLDASLRSEGKAGLTTVVVVCPTQVLVEQWEGEIRDYGFAPPLLAYESFADYANQLVPVLNQQARSTTDLRFVITTYATFANQYFAGALNAARGFGRIAGLIIGDEIHRACTVRVRNRLKEYTAQFPYRLGLSATPEIETDTAAERMLFEYFGGIQSTYELKDAIQDEVLCHYQYFPIPAPLDVKTSQRYFRLLHDMDEAERKGCIDINLYRERNDLIRNSDLAVQCFEALMSEKVSSGASISHTLVYCPPGRTDYEEDADKNGGANTSDTTPRHIEQIASILQRLNITKTAILGGDSRQLRKECLDAFASGKCQVLLGIGCLDEGLDIPNIREAIVLYSCDRERQFVQRRGRILRKAKAQGKDYAIIRDIILLPQNADMPPAIAERLLKREMRRYNEFAGLADNKAHAERILSDALQTATCRR